MALYTITAHNALDGTAHREFAHRRSAAIFQAERLFNRYEYIAVDVWLKDRRGRLALVHHIGRKPNEAEVTAILARAEAVTSNV